MEKKNKEVNLSKKNINNHKIFTAKGGMICIGEKKVRILFFNYPPGKKPDSSENRPSPVVIDMTRKTWFDLIDKLTWKTVVSLMKNKCKDTREVRENTEVMYR